MDGRPILGIILEYPMSWIRLGRDDEEQEEQDLRVLISVFVERNALVLPSTSTLAGRDWS